MSKTITDLIEDDHERIQDLIDQLMETGLHAEQTRKDLFKQLNKQLTSHLRGEEQYLYTFLQQSSESEDLVLEAIEEHRVIKQLLREVAEMPVNDKKWRPRLKVLGELTDTHFEEEEGEVLDLVEDLLDERQERQMCRELEAMRHITPAAV